MQVRIILLIYLFVPLYSLSTFDTLSKIRKKILIMPAGDAHTIGRYIGDSVERSLTLHYGQKMKSYIESHDTSMTVYLSRKAGDVVYFLQNAHLANCLDVDLALSLHFYQETEARPHFCMYTYKDASSFIKPTSQLMLYPYYQAYLFNQDKTDRFVNYFIKSLSGCAYQTLFTVHQPMSFPALPLAGLIPIACMMEIGVKDDLNYESTLESVCDILLKTLQECS
jgi:hypothetical protein